MGRYQEIRTKQDKFGVNDKTHWSETLDNNRLIMEEFDHATF